MQVLLQLSGGQIYSVAPAFLGRMAVILPSVILLGTTLVVLHLIGVAQQQITATAMAAWTTGMSQGCSEIGSN